MSIQENTATSYRNGRERQECGAAKKECAERNFIEFDTDTRISLFENLLFALDRGAAKRAFGQGFGTLLAAAEMIARLQQHTGGSIQAYFAFVRDGTSRLRLL